MPKPTFTLREEKERVKSGTPTLLVSGVALMPGCEVVHVESGMHYTVASIARWLATEGEFCVTLRPRMGYEDQLVAIAYEDLVGEDWLNLGL